MTELPAARANPCGDGEHAETGKETRITTVASTTDLGWVVVATAVLLFGWVGKFF